VAFLIQANGASGQSLPFYEAHDTTASWPYIRFSRYSGYPQSCDKLNIDSEFPTSWERGSDILVLGGQMCLGSFL
jgi:hypothetical protein